MRRRIRALAIGSAAALAAGACLIPALVPAGGAAARGAVGSAAAPPQAPPRRSSRLDSLLDAWAGDGFMGAVRIERGRRVLLDRACGFAELEWKVANTPDTRFRIGSLTKQFTAAAILLLQERGRLRTSDRLSRWIPEVGAAWDSIMLRQLLSHTSGIPNVDAADEFWPVSTGLSAGRMAVLRFRNQPLDFDPGTNFSYSNTGYLVLGEVIEAASGMSYEAFVRKNLLERAGLTDTDFDDWRTLLPRRAAGYVSLRDSVTNAPWVDMRLVDAAGGLYSTTRDLVRWEQALYGGRVLAPASLAEMIAPVHGDYACGVHHRLGPGHEVLYHSGRINGFDSLLGYYPADSLAIAVLSNLDGVRIERLFDALAAAAHEAPQAGAHP